MIKDLVDLRFEIPYPIQVEEESLVFEETYFGIGRTSDKNEPNKFERQDNLVSEENSTLNPNQDDFTGLYHVADSDENVSRDNKQPIATNENWGTPRKSFARQQLVMSRDESHDSHGNQLLKQMPKVYYHFRTSWHKKTFDLLSGWLNTGNLVRFKKHMTYLSNLYGKTDYDFAYTEGYLRASECIRSKRGDSHLVDYYLKVTESTVWKTASPNAFQLQLLTLKCWNAMRNRDDEEFNNCANESLELMMTDSLSTCGMGSAWFYVNNSRWNSLQIEKARSNSEAVELRFKAIECLQSALEEFQSELSADREFGQCFAGCRLASLLLCCDRNLFLRVYSDVTPTAHEFKSAQYLLDEIENSRSGLKGILRVQFFLAKSDFHFRKGNSERAKEYAHDALRVAVELNMWEEQVMATLRLNEY